MKHLLVAFCVIGLALSLAAQNPNCRPVIVVHNGFSAPIQPINTDADPETDVVGVRVKARDFVRSCSSPCGATTFQYRIRKAGDGSGIPADSTVLFTCTEMGTEEVDIWAIDPQGNAAYVQSYVLVQDNFEQCGAPVQSILPSCSQDVMRPTLVAINGLCINAILSPTGTVARVLASDFVASKTDNCTGSIRLRIRKAGQGTGVPTTTSVTFTCAELGAQLVEIWAGDSKGNWTWALTYVIVQGEEGDCGQIFPAGCSPDLTPVAIEALNGLAAPVGVNGRVRLKAEDWTHKRTDNCSIPIALRIRKKGAGIGPPTGTTVEFDCSELGTQEVEIWSRDLAGNWGHTTTYVIVQDNFGVCGQMKGRSTVAKTSDHLRLFPNPAAQAFVLESSGEPFSRIVMMDMMGRTVRNIELSQSEYQHTVQVADLQPGVYQVRAGEQVLRVVVAH